MVFKEISRVNDQQHHGRHKCHQIRNQMSFFVSSQDQLSVSCEFSCLVKSRIQVHKRVSEDKSKGNFNSQWRDNLLYCYLKRYHNRHKEENQ